MDRNLRTSDFGPNVDNSTPCLVGWLSGWLVVWLSCWLFVWLAGCLVVWLSCCLVGCLSGFLANPMLITAHLGRQRPIRRTYMSMPLPNLLPSWLVVWLAGCLVGWSSGCLVGWLPGWLVVEQPLPLDWLSGWLVAWLAGC